MKFPLKQFNAFVQDSGLADSQFVEYTRYLREMWHAQSGSKERLPESTCELGCGRLKEFRQFLQNACLTPNGVKFLEEERERFMNRRQQHNSRLRKKERLRDDVPGSSAEFSPLPRHDTRMGGSFPGSQFPSGPSGYPPYLPQLPQGGGPDMMRMGGGGAGGSVGGGSSGNGGGPGPAGQSSGGAGGMQRMPYYQYQWPPAGGGHGMMGQQGAMVMPQQSMMAQHVHGGQGGPGMMVMGGQQMVQQHGMPPPAGGPANSHAPAQYVMSLQHQLMQPSPSKNSSELDAARNLSMISSNLWGSSGRLPVESPRRGHPHGEFVEGPQLPPQQHHMQPYPPFQQMQYHHQPGGQQLGPQSLGQASHGQHTPQRGPPPQQHHQAPLEGPLPLGDRNSDDEADDDGDDDDEEQ